jgi:hypothetical protein
MAATKERSMGIISPITPFWLNCRSRVSVEAGEPVTRKSLRMNRSACLLVQLGRVDPAAVFLLVAARAPDLSARGRPRRDNEAPAYSGRNPPFRSNPDNPSCQ